MIIEEIFELTGDHFGPEFEYLWQTNIDNYVPLAALHHFLAICNANPPNAIDTETYANWIREYLNKCVSIPQTSTWPCFIEMHVFFSYCDMRLHQGMGTAERNALSQWKQRLSIVEPIDRKQWAEALGKFYDQHSQELAGSLALSIVTIDALKKTDLNWTTGSSKIAQFARAIQSYQSNEDNISCPRELPRRTAYNLVRHPTPNFTDVQRLTWPPSTNVQRPQWPLSTKHQGIFVGVIGVATMIALFFSTVVFVLLLVVTISLVAFIYIKSISRDETQRLVEAPNVQKRTNILFIGESQSGKTSFAKSFFNLPPRITKLDFEQNSVMDLRSIGPTQGVLTNYRFRARTEKKGIVEVSFLDIRGGIYDISNKEQLRVEIQNCLNTTDALYIFLEPQAMYSDSQCENTLQVLDIARKTWSQRHHEAGLLWPSVFFLLTKAESYGFDLQKMGRVFSVQSTDLVSEFFRNPQSTSFGEIVKTDNRNLSDAEVNKLKDLIDRLESMWRKIFFASEQPIQSPWDINVYLVSAVPFLSPVITNQQGYPENPQAYQGYGIGEVFQDFKDLIDHPSWVLHDHAVENVRE